VSPVIMPLGVVETQSDRTVHVRSLFICRHNGVEWTHERMSWLVGHTYNHRDMELAARLAAAVTAGVVWEDVAVKPGAKPDDPPILEAHNKHFYGKYLDESLKKAGF